MLLGKKWKSFQVFDKAINALPDSSTSFHLMQINAFRPGQKVKWIFGNNNSKIYSIYHAQYFTRKKKQIAIKYSYDIKQEKNGINEWSFTVPSQTIDQVLLTHIFIINDEIQREEKTIFIVKPANEEPEIIIDQYRKKLMPGSKETFVVTIKTKNENVLAELMTTMYDASLDKLEKHEWQIPKQHLRFRLSSSWDRNLNYETSSNLFENDIYDTRNEYYKGEQPLFWLNPLDYAYTELSQKGSYSQQGEMYVLGGKISGLYVQNTEGLQDVVVTVGYGVSKQSRELSSVVVTAAGSIASANVGFVILDGIPYEGDINKINQSTITNGIILKGADAIALYGSRAANGVLILSTKGPIVLPKPEEPPLVIRKNFSETAFFFPNIYADADGFYNIEFTMPESVTEWKWKLLAHTKMAKFMYAERNIVTQLPMMVQPNLPRFLYQGDKIVLQTRVTNLDTTNLNGKMNCSIEDAVTGEDLTASIITQKQQAFSVQQKSNSNVAYEMTIPENLLHPLTIKITARAGIFADGEEHTIPILSKKILVSQNVGFVLVNNKDSAITTPPMPVDATPYAMGMYITPKPQAAMINALPYLAFYKYGCAEQTFNKLLAHSIANKILRTDTVAQQTMENVKSKETHDSKPTVLPDDLSEETMPWLQLGNATALHQKNLLKLFDTLSGNLQIEKYLNDIKDLQNADGGITWFKGGKSSKYISNYLLAGFAKLEKEKLLFFKNSDATSIFNALIPPLTNFCDASFMDTLKYRGDDLLYIYARSCWVKDYPIPTIQLNRIEDLLKKCWQQVDDYSLNNQAILILSSMQYASKESDFYKKSLSQLESIRQLAISDNVNGIRWKAIADEDDLNSNGEETVANLAEAFEQTGYSKETIDGILHWLLNAKQDHNWSTTKSTARVVGLLYRHQASVVGNPVKLSANVGNKNLLVTDNLLDGNLFYSTTLSQFPAKVSVSKDYDYKANAGLNYYYFTANPPINGSENALKITKQLFLLNKQNDWEKINENTVLKIADKVKTTITINAPKQLKFVFIDEKRAATLEPVAASSEYEYGRSFSYYKSVRDFGYQFFAEQIPSGISTIEYETVVAKEGRFSCGTVKLQCMYKPEVSAYGAGSILQIK
jgi:TonB-dependent SusC/RagA subfamily outer membrane receptor